MKPQQFWMSLGLILGIFVVSSCGDDSDTSLEDAQLSQDVRLSPYELKSADWKVEVTYFDGTNETLDKVIEYRDGGSKDKIHRVLENGRFYIFTNDVKAEQIVIAPDGKMMDEQNQEQELTGCELTGSSEISGKATHVRLQLEWDLSAELKGEGCSGIQSLREAFKAYVQSELSRLNLKAGQDLFVGLEKSLDQAQSISLSLQIKGQINPDRVNAAQ